MVIGAEQILQNPLFEPDFRSNGVSAAAIAVHRKLPGYEPTPLRELPLVAASLGVERVWLKDESQRMGLPAFKILGASWAVVATVQDLLGITEVDWTSIADLRERCRLLTPMTLACATDGNHGRAVAHMARLLGMEAIVLVPADMAPARIEAIRGEGAEIRIIAGTYDDAIDASAALASDTCLVISDTAWPGYDAIPQRVIDGYATIMREIDAQTYGDGPDLIAVPIGVGALAAAVVGYMRSANRPKQPVIVGIEPIAAGCMLESARAGQPVQIPGPHTSIMSGLNCGIPSPLAWPTVSRGTDIFTTVSDDRVRGAMRELSATGVVAGECGAAGLAGMHLLRERGAFPAGIRSILLISTEGATDPAHYQRAVDGQPIGGLRTGPFVGLAIFRSSGIPVAPGVTDQIRESGRINPSPTRSQILAHSLPSHHTFPCWRSSP